MSSIHEHRAPLRIAHAVGRSVRGGAWSFFTAWLKYPLAYAAQRVIADTPVVSVGDLVPVGEHYTVPAPHSVPLHGWNARLDELIVLRSLVHGLGASRVLEIGTFDGRTTLELANAAPTATVYTLDLPPEDFDSFSHPDGITSADIGRAFRKTPEASRITQLHGDSRTYDYGPLGFMDMVFVDAMHNYKHGLADSRNALAITRPGGLVIWHDFSPEWPELVHAIREATEGMVLYRIAATRLAVVRV